MKIGTGASLPAISAKPAGNSQRRGGSAPPDTGFADLLAGLLFARSEGSGQRDHAAAIRPRIGAQPHSFESARLLVETALASGPSSAAAPQATGEPSVPAAVAGIPPDEVAAQLRDLLSGLSAAPAEAASSEPLAAVARGVLMRPASALAAMPEATGQDPVPPPIGATARAATRASGRPLDAQETAGATPDRPETTSAQSTRFAARLFSEEGGLRLLLRLPRLSGEERAELETRISALFDSLGHRRPRLVLQEIAKG